MICREEIITENLGLVHSCCKRFRGRGIEYDDLYQAGCLGLIKAVDNFDSSRGLMFSTYAVPVILGEVKRLFRDGGSVKVSRPLKELSLKAIRTSECMSKELGRTPQLSELAVRLGVSNEDVAEALCAAQPTMSLTQGQDDEKTEYDIPIIDEQEKLCENLSLLDAIKKLDDRDINIIKLRYQKELTQSKTAQMLGMTQVQVSRREKIILMKIRQLLDCV